MGCVRWGGERLGREGSQWRLHCGARHYTCTLDLYLKGNSGKGLGSIRSRDERWSIRTSTSLVKGCACGRVNSQIIVVYCLQAHGSGSSRPHSDSLESAGYWELGWLLHGKEAKGAWMDLLAWIGSTLIFYSEIKVL